MRIPPPPLLTLNYEKLYIFRLEKKYKKQEKKMNICNQKKKKKQKKENIIIIIIVGLSKQNSRDCVVLYLYFFCVFRFSLNNF